MRVAEWEELIEVDMRLLAGENVFRWFAPIWVKDRGRGMISPPTADLRRIAKRHGEWEVAQGFLNLHFSSG